MVAGFPLTGLILLQRLYVASFSRLIDHPAELRQFVTYIVTVAHAVVAPVAVVTLVLIDPIVRLVFGTTWLDAVPLFRWLWLGTLVVPTIAPLTGLLHASGRSRVVFSAALTGLAATWVAGVPLVLVLGEVGMAVAVLGVHASGVVVWAAARRLMPIRIIRAAALGWGCAIPAAVLAWWWQSAVPPSSLTQLFLCGAAALAVYAAALATAGAARLSEVRELGRGLRLEPGGIPSQRTLAWPRDEIR
jgi:O-antigen/teichoic acid export membrane protein